MRPEWLFSLTAATVTLLRLLAMYFLNRRTRERANETVALTLIVAAVAQMLVSLGVKFWCMRTM